MSGSAWNIAQVVALMALSIAMFLTRAITPLYKKMTPRSWRQVWSYMVALIAAILFGMLATFLNQS